MTHLLFLCPHGAAKSVIATALAMELAQQRGLDVWCANAGTEPDPANNPIVLEALSARGLAWSKAPTTVAAADVTEADIVVSMGVADSELPAQPARFVDWADVPAASEDVEGLIAVLEVRISALLDELDT